MATYTVTFRYNDTALTLSQASWLVFQKLTNGATPTNPKPSAFVSIGYGMYRFEYTAAEDVVFVLDGGSSVPNSDRYVRGVLSPMDTRLDDSITNVTAAISNVNSSVQSVQVDVGNIYSQVNTSNTTVNAVNNIVQTITENVQQVTSTVTSIDNSVTTVSTVIGTINEAAASTQTAIVETQAAISTVNNNVQSVNLNLAGVVQAQTGDLSDKIDALETKLLEQRAVIDTLLQFSTGRWKVHTGGPDANRMVYYSEDGTTALAKFDLKDITGSPTYAAAFERVPVEE